MTFKEFADAIARSVPQYSRRLIAIDGGGGAGKTTFATCLQDSIPGSYIVKVDDFYRPPQLRVPLVSTEEINSNFDWDRLRSTVIDAVKKNDDVTYQLYNFEKGTLSGKIVQIPQGAPVIVEGVWSMQSAFVEAYDYCIWLDAPADIRLERGVSRDGEDLRQVWVDEWIPIDDAYTRMQQPHMKADCIVDSVHSNFEKDQIVVLS